MINQKKALTKIDLYEALSKNSSVHTNVGNDFVLISSDKIRICLRDYKIAVKAQSDWLTPLGIFLTLLATLVSADFKKFLGINPDVWKAAFLLGTIFCFIWLIYSGCLAIKSHKSSDIEHVIERMELRKK
jgi:hypothetical protein